MSFTLPHWLRRTSSAAADDRFGFAIVGIGHIAAKVAEALRDSSHARVSAAVSRTRERAESFARKHRIPHAFTYDEWDRIAAEPTIDATYLALPVAFHREFAQRSFAAGKHVLCEKPMAATATECETMIAAARAAQRLLMLAYRLDYDPAHDAVKRLLAEGALGQIEHVESGFGFVAKPGWRLDPALAGGGSLFDVGVYPVHALHELFGEMTVRSAEIIEDPQMRMELDATWEGTLPGGATFRASSSYLRAIPDALTIRGGLGHLTLTHAYDYNRTVLDVAFHDGRTLHFADAKRSPSPFQLECEHLAHCARGNATLKSPGESGLRDMKTIAAIEAIATRSTRR